MSHSTPNVAEGFTINYNRVSLHCSLPCHYIYYLPMRRVLKLSNFSLLRINDIKTSCGQNLIFYSIRCNSIFLHYSVI
jgi:hypothetical protein